jgi:hypothetical protein
MSDSIEVQCPRCQTAWQQDLALLDSPVIVFKSLEELRPPEISYGSGKAKSATRPVRKIEQYHVCCSVCGTHWIIDVEDDGHG